jgi:hypothetical protein
MQNPNITLADAPAEKTTYTVEMLDAATERLANHQKMAEEDKAVLATITKGLRDQAKEEREARSKSIAAAKALLVTHHRAPKPKTDDEPKAE